MNNHRPLQRKLSAGQKFFTILCVVSASLLGLAFFLWFFGYWFLWGDGGCCSTPLQSIVESLAETCLVGFPVLLVLSVFGLIWTSKEQSSSVHQQPQQKKSAAQRFFSITTNVGVMLVILSLFGVFVLAGFFGISGSICAGGLCISPFALISISSFLGGVVLIVLSQLGYKLGK